MNTIFNGLNSSIQDAAKRAGVPLFEARDVAPQSFEDVIKTYKATGRIVVWSGGSDATIYRDPAVNFLFRAWHDWMHIQTLGDFTTAGEIRVCRAQMAQVGTDLARLIYIEIVGQARHYAETGEFPTDQVAFTLKSLQNFRLPDSL